MLQKSTRTKSLPFDEWRGRLSTQNTNPAGRHSRLYRPHPLTARRAGLVQVAELHACQYPEYRWLTANRDDSLRKNKYLKARRFGVLSRTEVFLTGEMLDAHLDVTVLARKATA